MIIKFGLYTIFNLKYFAAAQVYKTEDSKFGFQILLNNKKRINWSNLKEKEAEEMLIQLDKCISDALKTQEKSADNFDFVRYSV